MQKRRLVVRVDGGNKNGLGHLHRCILLAEKLKHFDIETVFACRQNPVVHSLFAKNDFKVYLLPDSKHELASLLYIENSKIADNMDGILFDLPFDLEKKIFDGYKNLGTKLLALDDHGKYAQSFDLLINSIDHPGNKSLQKDRNGHHFINSPEHIIINEALISAPEARTEEQILVAMGGEDPHNITEQVLKPLSTLEHECKIKVILGPANRFWNRINSFAKKHDNMTIVQYLAIPDLAKEYAKSKLALISFGLSAYALAANGVPLITLAHNEDIDAAASRFEENLRASQHLGIHSAVTDNKIKNAVLDLLESKLERGKMGKAGRGSIDGKGLQRVAAAIDTLFT